MNEDLLSQLIPEIESVNPRDIKRNTDNQAFQLCDHPWLTANLSGGVGALYMRAILQELNVDEHHIFKWRLENKYNQYLVLNHYCPGCVPKTLSFSKLYHQAEGISKITQLFTKGFFLKAALGHGSFSTNTFDRTDDFKQIITTYQPVNAEHEKWILQERLNLKMEFRIHTFSRDLITGLTFKLQGDDTYNQLPAENFVKDILNKLPDTILQGTFIGWDVGLADNGQYYVIETNFTGFHPEYSRGFQTSGYVEYELDGPIICAWLNRYFKKMYNVYISSISDNLLAQFKFYREAIFYFNLFENGYFDRFKESLTAHSATIVCYLCTISNYLITKLVNYFQRVKFAKEYYIIIQEEFIPPPNPIFNPNDNITVIQESTLFTKTQFQLIKQLSYHRRKAISCYHAIRHFCPQRYIIV